MLKLKRISFLILITSVILMSHSCSEDPVEKEEETLYLGADLSYVNEMDDCGGVFRANGSVVDAYELFADRGANLVRLRLWNNPTWTDYSNLEDVKRSIARAKEAGMKILLDFHYSDDWADPGKQIIPEAWAHATTNEELGELLFQYTYDVLTDLHDEDLLPEIVQIGNEINTGMLHDPNRQPSDPIDYARTVYCLQKGFQAVSKVESETGKEIETMVHIAQPENAFWWFPQAFSNGLGNFDWIGLSYYPKWSDYDLDEVEEKLKELKSMYNREIMIVETAYPHGTEDVDAAGNILGPDAIHPGFSPTPEGQRDFLKELTNVTVRAGGRGVVYWEPAWISTSCSTRWGQGSHWDNATFFDASNNNEALPAFDFFKD